MTSKRKRWQHVVPQGEQDHEVLPDPTTTRLVCGWCGKRIKQVPANDGPEGLKALFRW